MRTLLTLALPLALAALAQPASAQVFEAGGHGGATRLSSRDIGNDGTQGGTSYSLADGWRFGFRMTFNNWAFFGHEVGYAYNRTKLQFSQGDASDGQGMAIHQGSYSFLAYATPEGIRVRPFAAGGVHFNNYIPPGQSVTQGGGSNKFGINYGGGVKLKVTDMWGIRLDVRQYLNGKPFDLPGASGRIRMLEISAGVSFMI